MLLESFDTGAGCRTQINERYHASNPVCKPARTTANIVIRSDSRQTDGLMVVCNDVIYDQFTDSSFFLVSIFQLVIYSYIYHKNNETFWYLEASVHVMGTQKSYSGPLTLTATRIDPTPSSNLLLVVHAIPQGLIGSMKWSTKATHGGPYYEVTRGYTYKQKTKVLESKILF